MAVKPKTADEKALRDYAMGFPEAHEDFPWGHIVVKVKKKAFIFLGGDANETGGLSLTVKLPVSGAAAVTLPFAQPAGYGLGKSGWVSADFPKGKKAPIDLLKQWIDESYRAVAPVKLLKMLDGEHAAAPAPRAKKTRRTG